MDKYSFKIILAVVLVVVFGTTSSLAQEGTVIVNQDKNINRLLALKKSVNRSQQNYTIQIFKGSPSKAENVHKEFRELYGDWKSSIKFDPPNNRKIWVGNFKTRLEADRALKRIKKEYRNAFILKPKKEK